MIGSLARPGGVALALLVAALCTACARAVPAAAPGAEPRREPSGPVRHVVLITVDGLLPGSDGRALE